MGLLTLLRSHGHGDTILLDKHVGKAFGDGNGGKERNETATLSGKDGYKRLARGRVGKRET